MMKKLLLTGIGALMLTGCAGDGRHPNVGVGVSVGGSAPPPVIVEAPRGGPPPWAPAHGRRAKEARYRYYYYPSSGVYLNVATGSYFYLNGGSWQMTMALPSAVILDTSDYVTNRQPPRFWPLKNASNNTSLNAAAAWTALWNGTFLFRKPSRFRSSPS